MTVRIAAGIARFILAGVEVAALISNFSYVLGFPTFAINNFFSYFTIQSAMAAVLMLVSAGLVAFRRVSDPPWLDLLRAVVTTYLIVSGIVFAIIVVQASARHYTIEVPISDQVLHFWVPSLALVDWLIDERKARLSWKYLAWVVAYPIVWGVFTLVRGSIVGWYPYFFLDARQVTPVETVVYCTLCLILIVGISASLIATTHLRRVVLWRR